MALDKSRTFVRRPSDKSLYKWSPIQDDKKAKKIQGIVNNFCTAAPRSQGEDWIVTYVYELTVDTKNIQHRIAYVECDYVK
jgi:hypothetical protein